jgi:hypothetical protein
MRSCREEAVLGLTTPRAKKGDLSIGGRAVSDQRMTGESTQDGIGYIIPTNAKHTALRGAL